MEQSPREPSELEKGLYGGTRFKPKSRCYCISESEHNHQRNGWMSKLKTFPLEKVILETFKELAVIRIAFIHLVQIESFHEVYDLDKHFENSSKTLKHK